MSSDLSLGNSVAFLERLDLVLAAIREAIEETGWDQQSIAAELGVSKTTVTRWLYPVHHEQRQSWKLDHLVQLPPEVRMAILRKVAQLGGPRLKADALAHASEGLDIAVILTLIDLFPRTRLKASLDPELVALLQQKAS